jgi:ketosteroid isomerase-like protein
MTKSPKTSQSPSESRSARTAAHDRREVEEAWRHFIAVGDSGDWNAWADLHSEDGVWIEHHLGVFRGREAIRKAIVEVMKPVPMMLFPVEWHMVDGNRVVFYPWQVFPDPKGGDAIHRFGCVTVLEYAGEGLWSLQEDLYNPREAQQVIERWIAAGGRLAT